VVPAALITYRSIAEKYSDAPESRAALQELAGLYEDLKRYDLAAQALTDLAARSPNGSDEAWYKAAEIYRRRLRDVTRAKAAYERVPHDSKFFSDAQRQLKSLPQP